MAEKAYHKREKNIKGTLRNLQKTLQGKYATAMAYFLDNADAYLDLITLSLNLLEREAKSSSLV